MKAVQSDLEAEGYYTSTLDGIFVPLTEDAVTDFQADQGLTVDGLVGPETESALSNPEESTDEETPTEEPATEEPTPEEPSSDESASQSDVVSIAEDQVGTPYVWDGTTPDGFDSSGFILYVFD